LFYSLDVYLASDY